MISFDDWLDSEMENSYIYIQLHSYVKSHVQFSSVAHSCPTLCMRWPKYWSFRFSISPSNEYPGLISFRMDWMDPLAVQGTLKSLLQHHIQKHQFFSTQPSS